jgi:DNA-binding MarR family transcriptional regulator
MTTIPHVGDPVLFSAMCDAMNRFRILDPNLSLQCALAFVAIASLPGGCSQADVCDRLKLPDGYVSSQVNRLSRDYGLVDILPDKRDRRKVRLFLTPRGATLANQMRFAMKEAFRESL